MLGNNTFDKTLVLVDGNALMHRAFHGLGKHFAPTHEGQPVGMVYGFASIIINALEHLRPDCFIATFDTKEKTFRHKLDADYKANRTKAPDEFYAQIPQVFQFLEAFSVPVFKQPGVESDDLIGTFAVKAPSNMAVKILSSDMDFTQLLSEQIRLVKLVTQVKNSPEYGPAETLARYGVTPAQMVDFKAITGDASDNYKGIDGVGPKTAQKLIETYGSLDGIYQHLSSISSQTIRQKFIDQQDQVYHCQTLAQIKTDVDLEPDFSVPLALDFDQALDFLRSFNFRALEGRLYQLQKKWNEPTKIQKINTEEQLSLF